MQVAMFLGFVGFIVAVGGFVTIAGILILVLRLYFQKKTYKKYTGAKAAGIIIASVGGITVVIPVGIFLLLLSITLQDQFEHNYFHKDVKTGNNSIFCSSQYEAPDTFEYNDETYVQFKNLTVEYRDKRRGDAVANSTDGSLTFFEYSSDSDVDMLCCIKKVYCPKSQKDELTQYYRSCELKYTAREDSQDESTEIELDDDIFFAMYDYTDVVEPVDENGKTVKSIYDLNTYKHYEDDFTKLRITQNVNDEEFYVHIDFYISKSQEIYINGVYCDFTYDDSKDNLMQVTEPECREAVLEALDEVT
ncbi:MAG: hypothetical protein LUI06_02725 [Ruminococcus sp.]|nr:hypothetical protein [Ruminococcus sp.]